MLQQFWSTFFRICVMITHCRFSLTYSCEQKNFWIICRSKDNCLEFGRGFVIASIQPRWVISISRWTCTTPSWWKANSSALFHVSHFIMCIKFFGLDILVLKRIYLESMERNRREKQTKKLKTKKHNFFYIILPKPNVILCGKKRPALTFIAAILGICQKWRQISTLFVCLINCSFHTC